ncbi:MAG: hypothetical protein N2484_00140 [Clostridia bacterium]|nr:hypothetical protein [Clostridia bacterium]
MKHQNRYFGSKQDFSEFIRKSVSELLSGEMLVQDVQVKLPEDMDMDYKVKYEFDDLGGSFSLKVSWGSGGKSKEEEALPVEQA